ncbi:VQ motif-containing protein 4-like [Curcuma longa]|uniref:VQ motif-containing protein 4-like n=1 Tax=Curcuma longa TaxID=136217 RepID=UPI003D9F40E4
METEAISSSSSNHSCASGTVPSPPPAPLLTPKTVRKACEATPCLTTFVQADIFSFKKVVQMFTGSAETVVAAASASMRTGPRKQAFKLYERRNSVRNFKMLSPLLPTFMSSNLNSPGGGASVGFSRQKQPEVLSPSMLEFPSLELSPVTPLIPGPFSRSLHPSSEAAKWAEDRAIAGKGFYFHPSPRVMADIEPPRLLPLFPVTSPKVVSSELSLATPHPVV